MRKLFRLIDIHLRFFVAVLLLACGFAFAQDAALPADPGFDLKAWGGSTATFAAFVIFAVALIRSRLPKLNGWWWFGLSFLLSEGGAAGLYYAGLLTDPQYASYSPPQIWLLFGFFTFIAASGGWAALFMAISARQPSLTATATAGKPATNTSPALPPTANVTVNPAPEEKS